MRLLHKKTSGNKGFTMIEMIAVLIILGIVAAIVVSRITSNASDLIPQADIVKSHLRFAQLKALADETTSTTTWGIVFAGNSYTLQNSDGTVINLPGENGSTHNFPSGVTAGTPTVTFDSWGSPIAAMAVTLTQGSESKTITITPNTGYIP